MSDNDAMSVNDERELGILLIETRVIDQYAELIGPVAVALYVVLLRLSLKDIHSPSQTQLGKLLGGIDRKTVRKWLDVLEDHKLIASNPQGAGGLQIANEYRLLPVGKNSPSVRKIYPRNPSPSLGDDLPAIDPLIAAWESEARQMITQGTAEALHDYAATFGVDETIQAIKEAAATVGVGKFAHKYVLRILESWQRGGKGNKPSDDTFHSTMREV